jgi:hemerythrin-like domain-containing protein
MNKTLGILRDEHRSISAVLHGLKELARMAQDSRVHPDFETFRAMIRYIDQFPEQFHHPKEDDYLFRTLIKRAPQAKELVRELRHEHEDGARLVREIERALMLFEERWPAGAREFQVAVDDYAAFHWNHMRKEEQQLLPLAERYFTAQDWQQIDEAFAGNKDPIAGVQEKDFATLFTRIVNLAPQPVGLGDRWDKPRA